MKDLHPDHIAWLSGYQAAVASLPIDQETQDALMDAARTFAEWWEAEGPGATDHGRFAPAYLTPAGLAFLDAALRKRGYDPGAQERFLDHLAPLVSWARRKGYIEK